MLHWLRKRKLRSVLKKPCPASIPRTGKAGAEVDCYAVYVVGNDGKPRYWVQRIVGDDLFVREWTDSQDDKQGSFGMDEVKLNLSKIKSSRFVIRHYIGLKTIEFVSLDYAVLSRVTWLPYLSDVWIPRLAQIWFNQNRLAAKERGEILQYLFEKRLESDASVSVFTLLDDLHSRRWYFHDEGERLRIRTQQYLQILKEANEVEQDEGGVHRYRISAQGVKWLEENETTELRHRSLVSIQKYVLLATVALVVATLLLADLPFSNWIGSLRDLFEGVVS